MSDNSEYGKDMHRKRKRKNSAHTSTMTVRGPFLGKNDRVNVMQAVYCRELGMVIDMLVEMHRGDIGGKMAARGADEV